MPSEIRCRGEPSVSRIRPALLLGAVLLWTSAATAQHPNPTHQGSLAHADYQLEYQCRGEGRPVVFLEAPSGLSAAEAFAPVWEAIARRTRVCRLERLGFGASDAPVAGLVQTASDYASELHALVARTAPDQGIVIVGYSFGGFIARVYADRHRHRVAGLLLIDAPHEQEFRAMKRQMTAPDWAGLQEVFDWFVENLGHDAWTSQFEVARTRLDPALPVEVISRGLDHQRLRLTGMSESGFRIANDVHQRYQKALGALTRNTTRTVAVRSEHLIVESEPELVLAALDRLLHAVRQGSDRQESDQ
jgi:pimeloyl-ACP methyl ester carboxylesterase